MTKKELDKMLLDASFKVSRRYLFFIVAFTLFMSYNFEWFVSDTNISGFGEIVYIIGTILGTYVLSHEVIFRKINALIFENSTWFLMTLVFRLLVHGLFIYPVWSIKWVVMIIMIIITMITTLTVETIGDEIMAETLKKIEEETPCQK